MNDSRNLYVAGIRNTVFVTLALDDRPAMTAWPILAPSGLVELPTIDLDATVTITDITIEGIDWNATGYLYYRWEDGKPWTRAGSFTSLPYTMPIASENVGRYLKAAVGWKLTAAQQRQAGRPRITRIDCAVSQSGKRRGQLAPQTPPVV